MTYQPKENKLEVLTLNKIEKVK